MCLIGLLGILAPRVVLIALLFFDQPFIIGPFAGVWLWPLLGLFCFQQRPLLIVGQSDWMVDSAALVDC